ncbi:MAG: HEAT repeat domain-containing protein [bacterium]|nr:HEAT repeat domain-containing protein [bacterium]
MQENIFNIKIKNLVKKADKFEHMQFRLLLEEMVKQGGRDSEILIGSLATNDEIDSLVRINIIRIMGYVTSNNFLIPLRKILETEDNLNLRKAAIIAISKYNDKRALNMLSAALKRINNPVLHDSISSEISRIKQDNPILGLMPKFLNAVNDPKTFRTTMEVLKKVLNPGDAHVFIYHLKSETPFVGDGAFEILCHRGDESVKFSIFDYYKKKIKEITCIDEDECYSLSHLIGQLERFLVRNPETINFVLKDLKDIYKRVKDNEVKDLIINVFSSSNKREVLAFLEEVFNKDESRRDMVTEKLNGNEDGAYILLYKYKNIEELKDKLLPALLTTQKGSDYIIEIFETLSQRDQKLVLDNITISNYRFFLKLIEGFLRCKDYSRKRFALIKMSESRDFNFFPILFDPENEAEFLRMHGDFIPVISRLFPLKTLRFFLTRVINMDAPRPLMRKFFDKSNPFLEAESVLTLEDTTVLETFVEKLVKFGNKDMNLAVLDAFYFLKTLDYKTLSGLQKMIDDFKGLRGSRTSPEERGLLNKITAAFLNVGGDIKIIHKADSNINNFLQKAFPDYDILEYIIKTHPLAFFTNREVIIKRIKKTFQMPNELDAFDSIKFLLRFPKLSVYFNKEIDKCTKSQNYLLKQDADKLVEMMPKSLRIVLLFGNDLMYSFFKDQLHEILPEAEVTEGPEVTGEDILITDSESMDTLITENRVNTRRLYVLLKSTSEFAAIKEYNPKVFPPPFSLFKVLKAILPQLFTEEKKKE